MGGKIIELGMQVSILSFFSKPVLLLGMLALCDISARKFRKCQENILYSMKKVNAYFRQVFTQKNFNLIQIFINCEGTNVKQML